MANTPRQNSAVRDWWAQIPKVHRALVSVLGLMGLLAGITVTVYRFYALPIANAQAIKANATSIETLQETNDSAHAALFRAIQRRGAVIDTLAAATRKLAREVCIDRHERARTSARECSAEFPQ